MNDSRYIELRSVHKPLPAITLVAEYVRRRHPSRSATGDSARVPANLEANGPICTTRILSNLVFFASRTAFGRKSIGYGGNVAGARASYVYITLI
jgi:hypothetical protein